MPTSCRKKKNSMTGPRRCSYLTQTLTGVYQAVRMLSLLLKYIHISTPIASTPSRNISIFIMLYSTTVEECPNMLLEIAS